MVFSSPIFLFGFLPVLLGVYFLARNKYRDFILLIGSLIFYAWGGPQYLLLMLGLVFLDYVAAYVIDRAGQEGRRKLYLIITVCVNVGILAYYKYTDFLLDNWNYLTGSHIKTLGIVLPIGISFFTFQAMSYVIDVYRHDVKAQKNPFLVLLYVSLFPQLVAGPIVRYKTVEMEIAQRNIATEDMADGIQRFILGLAKKLIVANQVGELADIIFGMSSIDMTLAWLGAAAYTLQIYFDFSAYSDMAIGLGRMFGFHFEENFIFPYISRSVNEFWRRWHISLSTWFRDYIYIPLGGNRKGQVRMYVNMFIVWGLTGIWHGAEWNFLLWGLYYFVFLSMEKLFLSKWIDKLPRVLGHIYTMAIVMIGWVLFRCDDGLGHCISYVKAMFSFRVTSQGLELAALYLAKYKIYLMIGIVCSIPFYRMIKENIDRRISGSARPVAAVLGYAYIMGMFFISVLYLVNSTYNPFIYFRF